MKIAVVKKMNEKMPDGIKRLFAPVIRNRLIKNPVFLREYQQLCEADTWSEERMAAEQQKRLRQTLQYAYDQTKYYHKLFDEIGFVPQKCRSIQDLNQIPVLTKKLLQENLEEITSTEINNYYQVTTGGTTGAPVSVWMERDAIYKEWAFVYHYWSKYGYDYKKSRLATLRGVDFQGKWKRVNPLYGELRLNPFCMSERNIRQYVEAIKRYGAEFLYGYPSAIYQFCRLLQKQQIQLERNIRAVFLISENLYPFQETLIKEVLHCEIAIFYGHTERAAFAERQGTGYCFHPLYGVLQTTKEEGGELIATGFLNSKTPLIRYQVDDYGKRMADGKYKLTGHWNGEVLYGANGERISMAAINVHDDTFAKILEYQLEQTNVGECILRIHPMEPLTKVQVQQIQKRMSEKLCNALKVEIEVADQMKLTKRGKYRMLIQHIDAKTVDM